MNMKDIEARSPAPRTLSVQQGLVLPPGVLRAVLPDVASVVTNAMSSSQKEKIFGLRMREGATSAEHSKRPAPTEPQAQTTDTGKEPRHTKNILNPFPCNICKQWFPSRQTLNLHWLRHNSQCDYCKISFVSRDLKQKHKCCKFCEKLYKSKSEYNDHMKQQHGRLYPVFCKKRRLQCSICKQCFSKKNDLMKHVYEMIFTCKECQMCYRRSEQHVEHTKPEFSCDHCGEFFEESLSFTSHMRTHKTGPVKSYSRAPKKPKLSNTATQTRQDTSDVKCSEGVETSKRKTEETVNEIDKRLVEVAIEKSDFKKPTELNEDTKSSDVTKFVVKVEPSEFVSREAKTSLYSGHQIHEGVVLGPVRVLSPDVVYTVQSPVKSYSRASKKPKLTHTATQTRQDTSDVKCSEGVETSKRTTEETVNEIDKRLVEVVIEKSDFKKPTELNEDTKSSDVTKFVVKVEPSEFVSREAKTSLYSGHQIHEGVVLGPVRALSPDVVYTVQNGLNESYICKKEPASDDLLSTSPTAEPGPVKVEPALPIEEVYIVDSKAWFPSIKTEDIV